MISKFVKKFFSVTMLLVLVAGNFAGCSNNKNSSEPKTTQTPEATKVATNETKSKGGTILWLSNTSSGQAYDNAVAYATMICNELGYDLQIAYGDSYNDPAGNLTAVQNSMTKDVVGLIASQDGGIKDIVAAYPDLKVVGFHSDMRSVYGENGPSAEVAANLNFLGSISDGHFDGALIGKQRAKAVIEKGYKKVSTIIFPGYAFPALPVADQSFRSEIAAYNATVATDEQITIVGDVKVLEFQPLDETYFLEEGYNNLDAIVAMCAGTYVYPTMKNAIANGSCSADTKLITGGLDLDETTAADTGEDGVIQSIIISPAEDIAWSLIMLDNAINELAYADYLKSEVVDPVEYIIDSKKDIDNVMNKSFNGTGDLSKVQLTLEDIKTVLLRHNPNATYADLNALIHSEQLSVESLGTK
jgi:hypothetical protein